MKAESNVGATNSSIMAEHKQGISQIWKYIDLTLNSCYSVLN